MHSSAATERSTAEWVDASLRTPVSSCSSSLTARSTRSLRSYCARRLRSAAPAARKVRSQQCKRGRPDTHPTVRQPWASRCLTLSQCRPQSGLHASVYGGVGRRGQAGRGHGRMPRCAHGPGITCRDSKVCCAARSCACFGEVPAARTPLPPLLLPCPGCSALPASVLGSASAQPSTALPTRCVAVLAPPPMVLSAASAGFCFDHNPTRSSQRPRQGCQPPRMCVRACRSSRASPVRAQRRMRISRGPE